MRKFVYGMRRYLVVFGVIAVVCGTIGCLISDGAFVIPGEQFIRGIKTLGGTDYYLKERQIVTAQGTQAVPLNPLGVGLFEVARWSGLIFAMLATVSVLLTAVGMLKNELSARRTILHGGDVIAIHGDSSWVRALVKDLRHDERRVIIANSDEVGALNEGRVPLSLALKTTTQVLLFEKDDAALEFLERYADDLDDDARIYVHLNSIVPEGLIDNRVMPFSMAEICAQGYWETHPVTSAERIVLIGSGRYAEALLYQGLMTNIFDVDGGVRYDVIGDFGHWRSIHGGLTDALAVNGDQLEFHKGEWSDWTDLLLESTRVILCDRGARNVRVAAELQALPLAALHLRNDNESSVRVLGARPAGRVIAGPREVDVFGTNEELCTSALLVGDIAHDRGRICDVVYGLGTDRCNACELHDFSNLEALPGGSFVDDELRERVRNARFERMRGAADGDPFGACLSCPRFLEEWTALDGFTRRSNYAVAAHDGQKFRLLHAHGIDVRRGMTVQKMGEAYAQLPQEVRDELQEIEHIRWCRFCFLSGWRYAPGGKDKRLRTHEDLVPYRELRDDQSKDADAYLSLCLRIRSEREQAEFERYWLT